MILSFSIIKNITFNINVIRIITGQLCWNLTIITLLSDLKKNLEKLKILKLINFFKKVWSYRTFFLLKIHVLFKIFIYILRHKKQNKDLQQKIEGVYYVVLQEEGNADAEGSALCAERFGHYHKPRLSGCVLEHYQADQGRRGAKGAAQAAARTELSSAAKRRHRWLN